MSAEKKSHHNMLNIPSPGTDNTETIFFTYNVNRVKVADGIFWGQYLSCLSVQATSQLKEIWGNYFHRWRY